MMHRFAGLVTVVLVLFAGPTVTLAQQDTQKEIDELKKALEAQEESIRALKQRISDLERKKEPAAAAPAPAPAPVVTKSGEAPSPAEEVSFTRSSTERNTSRHLRPHFPVNFGFRFSKNAATASF